MKVIEVIPNGLLVAVGSIVFVVSTYVGDREVKVIRNDKSGDSHVVTMTMANETGNLYVGYSNKMVCCWDLNTLEIIGSSTLRKQPTSIQYGSFTADNLDRNSSDPKRKYNALLASDKAGEVFALDAPHLKHQSLLAGHTASVITDMAIIHGTQSFVATADRDEKIRISHFPDMENIYTFCLGHTNVVSSVTFAKVNDATLLLTTGWDNKLILWDLQGNMLQTVSFLTAEATSSAAAVEQKTADADVIVYADAEVGEALAGVEDADTAEVVPDADGDGEEDLEGKVYDEVRAGNYPMKVVCSAQNGTSATVAVIFKGTATLRLYTLQMHASTGKYELTEHSSVPLAAVPVDVVFSKDHEVSVVVPKPHGLQVFQVDGAAAVDVSANCAYISKLVQAAEEQGLDFALPDGSSSTHNATGANYFHLVL